MNEKATVVEKLRSFFNANEKFFFLNGTHQFEKHPLAIIAAVSFCPSPSRILFRTNHSHNTAMFLKPLGIERVPKPGTFLIVNNQHRLCADTINIASWKKTPRPVDVAIVYPVDSLNGDKGDECVSDLLSRGAKKILLVTWTDNKLFAWVDQFNPVRATYDAEADDPDYHKRVQGFQDKISSDPLANLPAYANGAVSARLCRVHCDRCQSSTWAELNEPYPGLTALRNADQGKFIAKCLKCGQALADNYNWYGRS